MTSRGSTGTKLACLFVPLAGSILALHAWGDGLRSHADRYWMRRKYQEHRRHGFVFRVRRGSDAHERAAGPTRQFVDGILERHRKELGLADPRAGDFPPVIHLLTSKEDLKPSGFPPETPDLDRAGGAFDPERGAMAVVVGAAKIHQEANATALRHQLVHAMLHAGAPRAAYSPWLVEGLAEHFAGGPSRDGDPPRRLYEILTERDAPYRSSRLLVEFLLNRHPDRFAAYCAEERKDDPVPPSVFETALGPLPTLESEWRRWVSAGD